VVTAESDSTRLLTGTAADCGTSCTVADGPFVLTSAASLDTRNITWLVQVDTGTDCAGVCASNGFTPPKIGAPVAALTTSTPSTLTAFANHLSGARFFVAPGKRLCACNTPVLGLPINGISGWAAWWSGFVPYQ